MIALRLVWLNGWVWNNYWKYYMFHLTICMATDTQLMYLCCEYVISCIDCSARNDHVFFPNNWDILMAFCFDWEFRNSSHVFICLFSPIYVGGMQNKIHSVWQNLLKVQFPLFKPKCLSKMRWARITKIALSIRENSQRLSSRACPYWARTILDQQAQRRLSRKTNFSLNRQINVIWLQEMTFVWRRLRGH